MKAIGVGAALAILMAGTAWAKIDVDNKAQGWIEPKREIQLAQWPRDADGKLIFGTVLLDCAVAAGHADDCTVKESEPANSLLGKAALALAPLVASTETSPTRRPLELSILYDTPPSWLHKPSPDLLSLVWPRRAVIEGLQGALVRLKCQVNKQGLVQECRTLSENPVGWGFGEAAIEMSPTFLMKPASTNGEPVVSDVEVPVIFGFGPQPKRFQNPPPVRDSALVRGVSWSKTPVPADILKLLDKKVGDRFADGKVVLMCALDETAGKLVRCSVVNASSDMTEFASVARELAGQFQVDPQALAAVRAEFDQAKVKPLVFVPFSFPDMTSATWNKRYLSHVQWTYIPAPGPGHPLFPEEAIKAGIKEGVAAVDCVVTDDGSLHDCSVTQESTPGVGLGAMAKTIAEASTVNPWTEEGLPAGGAHVRMPIRMDYTPSADAAPTPATTPSASPESPPPAR